MVPDQKRIKIASLRRRWSQFILWAVVLLPVAISGVCLVVLMLERPHGVGTGPFWHFAGIAIALAAACLLI